MMILEIFMMFDTAKVEIKKEHQLLMVGKTTSFKKGKGNKGYFMKRQTVAAPVRNPRLNPNPRLSASVIRGATTGAELR